jgi:glycosyltransferase involved in cell wall biosynthesis
MENVKKIIFVTGSMRRGGAERVISILANDFQESNVEVTILTLLDNSNEYKLNDGIRVINITKTNYSRIKMLPIWIKQLRIKIKEIKPDLIISFIARVNLITIFSSIGIKTKLIISERSDPIKDGRSLLVRLGTYFLYPFADLIVFQTNWAKSSFSNKIRKKSVVIRNPINVQTKAKKIREQKIVSVGRLYPEKNHFLLIDAFKEIIKKFPEYKLVIYGEGILRNELSKYINELLLNDKVFLPGSVAEVHNEICRPRILCQRHDNTVTAKQSGYLVPSTPVIRMAWVGAQIILKRRW